MWYNKITARGKAPSEFTGQEVGRMEQGMTQSEFLAYLKTLAQLIEAKAKTAEDAVKVVRELMERIEKKK